MSEVEVSPNPKKMRKMSEEEDEDSRKEDNQKDDEENEEEAVPGQEEEGNGLAAETPPAFVHQYQVVKTILENLKLTDLLQASQVNKQWRDIGRIVRKQRKNLPGVILYHPYIPQSKMAFEYFNGGKDVSEEAKRLVESGNDGYHAHRRSSRKLFPDLLTSARSAVDKFVDNTYDEIEMLIAFATESFDAHLVERATKMRFEERIKPVLERLQGKIPCLTSFSCGMIATLPDCNKSLELERKNFPCLSGLAVPKVSGLRMKLFSITISQSNALKRNETAERCKSLLGIDDETESNLKGIMLLHKAGQRAPIVTTVCKYLQSNPSVGLAGGLHNNISVSGTPDDTILAAGVLIYGDESVRVSTAALNDSLHLESKSCLQKLEELKTTVIPNGNSFAFMFACNGRGRAMHRQQNVESDLFNSVFPKTPLAGAFTYGEFCHEVAVPFPGQPVEIKPPTIIDFGYHTIFLVVSYKHPREIPETN